MLILTIQKQAFTWVRVKNMGLRSGVRNIHGGWTLGMTGVKERLVGWVLLLPWNFFANFIITNCSMLISQTSFLLFLLWTWKALLTGYASWCLHVTSPSDFPIFYKDLLFTGHLTDFTLQKLFFHALVSDRKVNFWTIFRVLNCKKVIASIYIILEFCLKQ